MLKKNKRISKDEASILSKRTKGEKILFAIVTAIFSVYSISLLYPLLYLFINSFQHPLYELLNPNPFAFPDDWHFENYIKVFTLSIPGTGATQIYLWQMFLYSVYYGFTQVVIPAFTCSCVGYVLSKYEFRGRNLIYMVCVVTMTVPVVGTGASALKLAHMLGTWNNPILDLVTHFTGYGLNFMIMYAFFKNVSWSYAEAVFIDGGGHFTAFVKVMLPQAKTAILTICIISFIAVWNNYERPLIYFPDYLPLAAGLYMIKGQAARQGNQPFYYAGLVIATVPLIVIYSMCSEIIFKNFSIGGLKG